MKEFEKIMKENYPQKYREKTTLPDIPKEKEKVTVEEKPKNLTFKISKISEKGLIKIKFSEPVFEFENLNSREIILNVCSDSNCQQ